MDDSEFIRHILAEVLPGETELRPDIAGEAARAAAAAEEMALSKADEGDASPDLSVVELIYGTALFVAALVRIAKDGYDLTTTIADRKKAEAAERAVKSDERLGSLPKETVEKATSATFEGLSSGQDKKDKNEG